MNLERYIHNLMLASENIISKYYNARMGLNPYMTRNDFRDNITRIYSLAEHIKRTQTIFSDSLKTDFLIIENNFYNGAPQLARLRTCLEFNKRSIVKFLSPIIISIAIKALTSYSNWIAAGVGLAAFIIAPKILDAGCDQLRREIPNNPIRN